MLSEYVIYCTEEQEEKAIKLGAKLNDYETSSEEIIRWLETKGIDVCVSFFFVINPEHKKEKVYTYQAFDSNKCETISYSPIYTSKKEAVLAVIDVVLDYLITNNYE